MLFQIIHDILHDGNYTTPDIGLCSSILFICEVAGYAWPVIPRHSTRAYGHTASVASWCRCANNYAAVNMRQKVNSTAQPLLVLSSCLHTIHTSSI